MKKLYFFLVALMVGLVANAADWYLVGANYGWSDQNANKFNDNGDGTYSLTVASLAGEIKIKEAGKWNTSFGSNGAKLVAGVEYQANKDAGNIQVDGIIENASIKINPSNYTILVTGAAAENDYSQLYVVGDFGSGWSESNTDRPLTPAAGTNNKFSGALELTAATSYFKIKAGNNVYGTGGEDIAVSTGEQYTMLTSGNAFTIGAGSYTITVTLDKNADSGTFVVTKSGSTTPDPTPTYPTLYFVGANDNWDFTDATKMAEENGVYTLEGVDFQKNGGFKVSTQGWGEQWGGSSITISDSNLSATLESAPGEGTDAKYTIKGKYDIEFVYATKKITFTKVGEAAPFTFPDLYVRGELPGAAGWVAAEAYKMTCADGVYTITLPENALTNNGNAMSWKIGTGESNNWNSFGSAGTIDDAGDYEVTYGQGSANILGNLAGVVTLTLTTTEDSFVDGAKSTLKVEVEGGEVTPPTPTTTVAILGAFNEWSTTANATTEIEDNCAKIVVANYTNGTGDDKGFKVQIDGKWYATTTTIANGEWVNMENNEDLANMQLPASAEGKSVTFTVAVDAKTMKVEWEAGEVTPPTPTTTVAILGAFNSWNTTANSTTEIEDNCAKIVVENYKNAVADQGEGFKVKIDDKWYATTTAIANGEWVNMENNEDLANMQLPASAEGRTVTFTVAVDAKTMKVEWEEGKYSIHLLFNAGSTGWTEVKAHVWKGEEYADLDLVKYAPSTTMPRAESNMYQLNAEVDFVPEGILFYDGVAGIESSKTADAEFQNNYVYTAGEYKDGVYGVTSEPEQTGIEGVAVDVEVAPVYYNLNGVRVENPVAGLYIVVRGNKVTKELVK